jgi:predicted nucleotidyltransferase
LAYNIKRAEVEDKHLKCCCDRQEGEQIEKQHPAQQAMREALQMVDTLVKDFGATQIILFGSLAWGRFAANSNIDLAVEGISPEHFFTALAAVSRLTDRWVELKPLEALEPHFHQRVLATGEVLYAQDFSRRVMGAACRTNRPPA